MNRITPQVLPDGCTDACSDYVFYKGIYYSLISPRYNVRLDHVCGYDCDCPRNQECAPDLPEIDLDRLCYGSDSVEPIKRTEDCDEDSK